MKMKGPFLPSKQLLVFNGAYVLIAVVRSLHSAADFSGINLQSISFSCIGIELGNAQNGTVDLGRFSLDNMESVTLYNGQK